MEGRYGGPQARIASIVGKLKRYGIETIAVIPINDSEFFYKRLLENGTPVRRMRLHRLTKRGPDLFKFLVLFVWELFSLYRMFKEEQVNIVHCNGSWQIKGVVAGKLARKRVVWHLNDTEMPGFMRFIFRFVALHFCDFYINAGKRVKGYYLKDPRLWKKHVVEIQSPVDTSIFSPKNVRTDEKIVCFDGLKILTVGNLNARKGIEYFIEMASILNKQYDNLNFFVVGSHFATQSKYIKAVSDLVKSLEVENVHFYGTSDDVPAVLKAADVYVCSSISEASPISVWEAMSMARAIVTTDVGDVAQFIRDGHNGFVVPIKDAIALAEKVDILIENEKLRKDFGSKSREVAVKFLDVDVCAKKHAQFYREIMERSQRA
jgi:glycosyltransferase involved in cell wall biosynthesis